MFDQSEGEKGQNSDGCANPGGCATCGFVSRIELNWEVWAGPKKEPKYAAVVPRAIAEAVLYVSTHVSP